mmetsp:Transcript_10840/g.45134  ORF Transcript_10840/g.45134 Transcript_10840/m.45134 type:complete len:91 (-) Transcript_10840:497-769(-)
MKSGNSSLKILSFWLNSWEHYEQVKRRRLVHQPRELPSTGNYLMGHTFAILIFSNSDVPMLPKVSSVPTINESKPVKTADTDHTGFHVSG